MLRKHLIEDINQYPALEDKTEIKSEDEGRKELTIGDLHSNALKLLRFLLLNEVVVMRKGDFDNFVTIYNTQHRHLNKVKLKLFDEIVGNMKVTDKLITLRLIGDEVADRGSNDYFVLKLLAKLSEKKNLLLEILYSNHGHEFILAIFENREVTLDTAKFGSLYKYIDLIHRKILVLEKEEVLFEAYAPIIKLISYTMPTLQNPWMMIYSHAPLKDPIEVINALAESLEVAGLPSDESYASSDIAAAIDRINAAFRIKIQSRSFHKVFEDPSKKKSFQLLAFGRINPGQNKSGFKKSEFNVEIRKNMRIKTVHGHTRSEELPYNFGLDDDNDLGKVKRVHKSNGKNYDSGNLCFLENIASTLVANEKLTSLNESQVIRFSHTDHKGERQMLRNYFVENINTYPSFEEKKSDKKSDCDEGRRELTLGDLHANALKLLQFLLLNKVIVMSKEDFGSFVAIYNTDNAALDKEKLKTFGAMIDSIKVTDQPLTLRLIGDDVGDRGSNDYFVLKLLAKLREHKNLELEILLSNHGYEFIQMVLEGKELTRGLGPGQYMSMFNFVDLINTGMIDDKEKTALLAMYEPLLKLMSYTLPTTKNPKIIVYSHAPLKDPIEMINVLAKGLGVDGLSAKETYTPTEIAAAIDRLNAAFQVRIKSHTFHEIFKFSKENAFALLAWARVNPHPYTDLGGFEDSEYNKEIRQNSNIVTAHGHSPSNELEHNIGLDDDNNLGKLKGVCGFLNLDSGNLPFLESFAPAQLVLTDNSEATIEAKPMGESFNTSSALISSTLSASNESFANQEESPVIMHAVLWNEVDLNVEQYETSKLEGRVFNINKT